MKLFKTQRLAIFLVILLMPLSGPVISAQTKVYQYDGDLPFVKMMLNMMTVMGILDRLPNNRTNNNYGESRYGTSSKHSTSPWGNPSWGVLPAESYTLYGAPSAGDDLSGWVNESWEKSERNSNADRKNTSSAQPQMPIVQNFSYNVPENSPYQARQYSPLEKRQPLNPSSNRSLKETVDSSKEPKLLSQQKPCVTDFCGLKKPILNGLWVAENGELLGVKNSRYLWSDSKSRYLTGTLKVQNEFLLANIDGYERLMKFKYKLAGNRLLMVKLDGEARDFTRLSAEEYYVMQRGRGEARSY